MNLLQIEEPGSSKISLSKDRAIGIDLGTTNSLISVFENGKPKLIHAMPSIVSFGGDVQIHSIKRLMGKGKDDLEYLQSNMQSNISFNESKNILELDISGKKYNSIEISAQILQHLKEEAESYYGEKVSKAVITVPAYFDDASRAATKDAASLAGLEVLRLINEPTAAALAYGLDNSEEGVYIIYDLGGGTFDVSILNMRQGVFQVLATGGDANLGGDDIDLLLAKLIEKKSGESVGVMEARLIKEKLSNSKNIGRVSRKELEKEIKPLVDKTISILEDTIYRSGIDIKSIKGVVLVGGSTKAPIIKERVTQCTGIAPKSEVDPDRVVAYGAGIQAYNLTNSSGNLLIDITPLSLGIETMGGIVEKIVQRNSPVPASMAKEFTTYQNGQTGIVLHVLQGEREMVEDCRSLARFELKNIPPMKAGIPRIKVIFKIDADGMLTVEASEETTGAKQEVEIKPSYGLSRSDIEDMLKQSIIHAKSDFSIKQLVKTKIEANKLIQYLDDILLEDSDLLKKKEEKKITEEISQLKQLIEKSHIDKIKDKINEIEKISEPIAARKLNKYIGKALGGKEIDELAKDLD